MIQKIKEWGGVVALVAIILIQVFGQSGNLASSGSRFPNGLSADSTSPSAGQLRGTTATITGSVTAATTSVSAFGWGGSNIASSTSNTAETLAASMLTPGGSIIYTPNTGATTLTFPTSAALTAFVPNAGNMATVLLRNSTTTTNANGYLTLAGNTGVNLESASSTLPNGVAGNGRILTGGKGAWLLFWRSSTSTDVYVSIIPLQ